MTVVAQDTVVKFLFVLKDRAGEVLDLADDPKEAMVYLHGHRQVVPGLERAFEGHKAGDVFEVRISPEEGYGVHNPEGVFEVDRRKLPPDLELKVGIALANELPDGTIVQLHVLEVGKDTIKVDANHPLAGEELHFRLEVLEVRPATAEEIEHGHAHDGDDGHGHGHHHHHH